MSAPLTQLSAPPSGQTCGQYANGFANAIGAYINNPNATDMCEYCQYSESATNFLGWADTPRRWRFLLLSSKHELLTKG